MEKLARLPVQASVPAATGAKLGVTSQFDRRFYAFISYSHKDSDVAEWLHGELERFRVPRGLVGRLTSNGVVPRRLNPVFRDQHELAAADDLGVEIRSALASSQFLLVLCSPAAAKSHWCNTEIATFKRDRPDGCILAAVVAGEPFASDQPGREDDECFPPALRRRFDRLGRPTNRRAEPLAADFRDSGDGRRLALRKLVAGMLGVGLDELVHRESTRRHRRLACIAAASLAGMATTSTLAFVALQARNTAQEQRRQAEGLISFMLGDLKNKLEPIGRLDALDGVGERVLAYYHQQNTAALSDSSLTQRSKALALSAGVANARGNLAGASRLYAEALAGTAELIRRRPEDPQRLFDHAQNVFYLGEIALRRGDEKTAEKAFRTYKELSAGEVALDPNNLKWRVEVQSADANLGVMLFNQRRFTEATKQLEQALRSMDALVSADPSSMDYRKSLVETLAWVADSHMAEGRLDASISDRERDVALLRQLLLETRDSDFRWKLIAAERTLARLYAVRGRTDLAIEMVRDAIGQADQLLALEPTNRKWAERAAQSKIDAAQYSLAKGHVEAAFKDARSGCALANALYGRDATVVDWRILHRDCLRVQTDLSLASGQKPEALLLANEAVGAAKTINSTDLIDDRYALARAYLRLGDVQQSTGEFQAAQGAWTRGFGVMPKGIVERPNEKSVHEALARRLRRSSEAEQLARELAGMGYVEPES